MRNSPYRCGPKNWEQRRPYPFPTGCRFVRKRSAGACKWTSRDRGGLGWLLSLSFGPSMSVVPIPDLRSPSVTGLRKHRGACICSHSRRRVVAQTVSELRAISPPEFCPAQKPNLEHLQQGAAVLDGVGVFWGREQMGAVLPRCPPLQDALSPYRPERRTADNHPLFDGMLATVRGSLPLAGRSSSHARRTHLSVPLARRPARCRQWLCRTRSAPVCIHLLALACSRPAALDAVR